MTPRMDDPLAGQRERLRSLLRTLAYERRTVVLSSGRTSDFYIDCRRVSLHAEGMVLCGRLLYAAYRRLGEPLEAVGGPTLGADPLLSAFAVTAYLAGEPMPAFIVRKEPKGHGTGQRVEGRSNLRNGARVLLVEDVVTTGASTLRTIEACRAEGLVPAHVLALVDRREGGLEAIAQAGVAATALFGREHIECASTAS